MKSHRIAAAALVVVLVACSSGETLPRLDLSSAGSARDAAKGETASDMPLFTGPLRYEAATEDWGAAGAAHETKWPAWEFVAPATDASVTTAFSKVATALGFHGTPAKQAGSTEWLLVDKAADLTFAGSKGDGALWWNVYGTSLRAAKDAATPECPPNAACAAPDWLVAPTTVPPGRSLSVGEAERKAVSILARTGIDVSGDGIALTSSHDTYGTYVGAAHLFRGSQTGMSWSFTFGADGVVLGAGGPVFALEQRESYPVITVDDALARLNDGLGSVSGAYATRQAGQPDTEAGDTLKVTGASVSLVPWWMHDGGQMLLPAYDFALENGSHVSVIAVTDRYVKFAGPSSGDVPASDTPGSGSSGSSGSSSGSSSGPSGGPVEPAPTATVAPVTVDMARALIGLTLAEAQKVCDGNGWTLRVASEDGKENFLTTDWSQTRVNVDLVKGAVTRVSVG